MPRLRKRASANPLPFDGDGRRDRLIELLRADLQPRTPAPRDLALRIVRLRLRLRPITRERAVPRLRRHGGSLVPRGGRRAPGRRGLDPRAPGPIPDRALAPVGGGLRRGLLPGTGPRARLGCPWHRTLALDGGARPRARPSRGRRAG